MGAVQNIMQPGRNPCSCIFYIHLSVESTTSTHHYHDPYDRPVLGLPEKQCCNHASSQSTRVGKIRSEYVVVIAAAYYFIPITLIEKIGYQSSRVTLNSGNKREVILPGTLQKNKDYIAKHVY